ncbi:MAG: hypothetical protein O7G85_12705, partial [Planctomycetota bacterium]|nr:hypothetical protein [Planctomycetota bacterium]
MEKILKRCLILTALLLGLQPLSSCNIITPLVFVFSPDPTVEAVFPLEDRPTVVFVDDRRNLLTPTSLRRVLADQVTKDLMKQEVVTITISPQDAAVVARRSDTDD